MDSAGEDAHKRTGTSCIKTSPGNFFESKGNRVTAYSNGQNSGSELLSEKGGSNECILNNLEQGVLLCIPSFLPNNTGSEQDKKGQAKKLILVTSCWHSRGTPKY